MINIFLNSSYPVTENVYSNELNANGGRKLDIAFWEDDSTPFDVSDKDVTATFVTDNVLIADSIIVDTKHGNRITLDISSNNNYTIIPGTMLVEFEFKKNNIVTAPATAMIVKVRGSIKNNAQITPESYGTVSEILAEVAEARGTFNSLDERLDDIDSQLGTLDSDIDDISYDLNQLCSFIEVVSSAQMFDNNTRVGAIFHGSYSGVEYLFWTVEVGSDKTQYRISKNGIEWRKKENDTWGTFSIALPDNAVDSDNIKDYSVNFSKLGQSTVATSGSASQAWAFANDTTLPTTLLSKLWIKDIGDNRIIKGKYSIGFNSDGSIRATANVTGLNLSLGGSTSVYVANQVSQITENFGRSGINPDLTYLYVDNEQGIVDIDESILNDSNITIYYKGEFSIIDLIIDTLMATVSVISQVNTMLENAINGVSE